MSATCDAVITWHFATSEFDPTAVALGARMLSSEEKNPLCRDPLSWPRIRLPHRDWPAVPPSSFGVSTSSPGARSREDRETTRTTEPTGPGTEPRFESGCSTIQADSKGSSNPSAPRGRSSFSLTRFRGRFPPAMEKGSAVHRHPQSRRRRSPTIPFLVNIGDRPHANKETAFLVSGQGTA